MPTGAESVVRSQVIGYRRLRQFSEEVLEDVPLEMPVAEYETAAVWWDLPDDLPRELAGRGLDFLGGIHAAEHAAIGILPLFAMCDRWDIGGLSTPRHPDTDVAQIFIYDGFPGGVGIAEKGFELLPAAVGRDVGCDPRLPVRRWLPELCAKSEMRQFQQPVG